jgi:hypothetical protein
MRAAMKISSVSHYKGGNDMVYHQRPTVTVSLADVFGKFHRMGRSL